MAAGALLLLVLGVGAWGRWRTHARAASTPKVAVVLPPDIPGSEGPWLPAALWDAAEQLLTGEPGLVLVRAPQVKGYLQASGGGGRLQPQAVGSRFGAHQVVSIQGALRGRTLQLQVSLWGPPWATQLAEASCSGTLEDPQALVLGLHHALQAALGGRRPGAPSAHRLPRHPQAFKAYGEAVEGLESGDPAQLDQSLASLRTCLSLDPAFVPAQIRLAVGLGEQFVQTGWFQPGDSRREGFIAFRNAVYRAQALDPHHPLVRVLAARLQFLDQHFQAAIEQSEAILAEDPYLVDAHLTIADSCLALPGPEARERARQHLERILALGDHRFYPNFRITAVNLQEGNLDKAVALGDKLIQGWPDRMMSYVMPSNALLWLNRPQEARSRIEAGLRRFPDAKLLHRNLAYAAFEARDEATLEGELVFAARSWAPDQSTGILIRGLRPALKGDLRGTQDVYGAFLQQLQGPQATSPVEPLAASIDLYFMARTLATLGDPDKGRRYVDAAERLFPNWSHPARMDPAFR